MVWFSRTIAGRVVVMANWELRFGVLRPQKIELDVACVNPRDFRGGDAVV